MGSLTLMICTAGLAVGAEWSGWRKGLRWNSFGHARHPGHLVNQSLIYRKNTSRAGKMQKENDELVSKIIKVAGKFTVRTF